MSDPRLDLRRRLLASFDPLVRRAYDWVVKLELDDAAKADRIEALEARVAALTAALRDVIEHYDSDDSEGYYRPLDDAVEVARAALAAEALRVARTPISYATPDQIKQVLQEARVVEEALAKYALAAEGENKT